MESNAVEAIVKQWDALTENGLAQQQMVQSLLLSNAAKTLSLPFSPSTMLKQRTEFKRIITKAGENLTNQISISTSLLQIDAMSAVSTQLNQPFSGTARSLISNVMGHRSIQTGKQLISQNFQIAGKLENRVRLYSVGLMLSAEQQGVSIERVSKSALRNGEQDRVLSAAGKSLSVDRAARLTLRGHYVLAYNDTKAMMYHYFGVSTLTLSSGETITYEDYIDQRHRLLHPNVNKIIV